MKPLSSRRLRYPIVVAAATIGLTLSAIGAAQAFTFEGQNAGDGGNQGFTDLQMPGKSDAQTSHFNTGGHTLRDGNATFQFGSRPSFDQRYNPNNLFDPFAREGR
jgi:hypothetical protein